MALYPKAETLKSANRLIDSLVISNYSVLVVINQSHFSDKFLLSLSTKPIEILTRPNLGRDFGAYKIGFLHAEKSGYLEDIDNLLFANDSMFYGPESIGFINSMLKVDTPWSAMFVNQELYAHAQSFFQVFQNTIFKQLSFSKYWCKYYPHDLRHKVIGKGEKSLSKLGFKLDFYPTSYVSAEAILKHPEFVNFTPDEKFAIFSRYNLTIDEGYSMASKDLIFLMKNQYFLANMSHFQALLATRILKAPIKIDIFQDNYSTLDGVRDVLISLGVEQDELKDILKVMLLNRALNSSTVIDKFFSAYGLYRLRRF